MGTPEAFRPHGTPGSVGLGPCSQKTDLPVEGCYPSEALGVGPQPQGRYLHSRWAEDWSFLRNDEKRPQILGDFKYVPLSEGGDIYLTLNGQERPRFNFTSNPGLRDGPAQNQFLVRTVLGADLHVTPYFRAYVEVASGQMFGKNAGAKVGRFSNDALLNQAFVEAHVPVAGGIAGARFGRQEFGDGSPLLISTRDGSNLRTTFNGVRTWMNWSSVRVQAFDFHPTVLGVGGFGDDKSNPDERIRGLNAGFVVTRSKDERLFFEPFLYDYRRAGQRWGGVAGEENRNSFGARLWGMVGPVTLDWTVARQTGSFVTPARNASIDALGLRFVQTYRFMKHPWRPEIGVHLDYGSGGGAYDGGKLRTFNYMFGIAPYYSYGFFFSPSNFKAVSPTLAVSPTRNLRVAVEYQTMWRASKADAVYAASGIAYAGTQGGTSSRIGTMPRLSVAWNPIPQLGIALLAERLNAGPVLKRAGYSGSTYVGPLINFRF